MLPAEGGGRGELHFLPPLPCLVRDPATSSFAYFSSTERRGGETERTASRGAGNVFPGRDDDDDDDDESAAREGGREGGRESEILLIRRSLAPIKSYPAVYFRSFSSFSFSLGWFFFILLLLGS